MCQQQYDDDEGDTPGASYAQMPMCMSGAEIVELRQHIKWSQAQLARRIGYSQSQVSRWEHDALSVPPEACSAILRAVTDATLSPEEQRLARYQLQRWLRNPQQWIQSAAQRLRIKHA